MLQPFAVIGFSFSAALMAAFFIDGISPEYFAVFFLVSAGFCIAIRPLRKKAFLPAVFFSAFAAMIVLIIFNISSVSGTDVLMENEAVVTGTICELPYERNNRVYYKLETSEIDFPDSPQHTKILVSSSEALRADLYDTVKAKVKFYPKIGSDRNYDIAKGNYLRGSLQVYSDVVVTHNEQKPLYYYALMLRKSIIEHIYDYFGKDDAAFISALFIGDKTGISYDDSKVFRNAGITHIIVASGFHLAIITGLMSAIIMFIFRCRKNIASLICVPFVLVYMAAAGFTPSILRAGIMMIIYLVGNFIYSQADSLNSLGIAVLIICFLNPYSVCDAGFLLSVSATLGIIIINTQLNEKVYSLLLPKKSGKIRNRILLYLKDHSQRIKTIISVITVPVSAIIFTFPVTILLFNFFAPYSLITNVLVYFAATILLWTVFILIIADISVIFRFLKLPLIFICTLLTRHIIEVASKVSELPYAGIRATGEYVPIVFIIVIGITVSYRILKNNRRRKTLTVFIVSSVLLFTIGNTADIIMKTGSTKLSLIDSGKGITAVLTKDNETAVLYCGGSYERISNVNTYLEEISADELSYILMTDNTNQSSAFIEDIMSDRKIKTVQVYNEEKCYERLHRLIGNADKVIYSDKKNGAVRKYSCCGTEISVFKTEKINAVGFILNGKHFVMICGSTDCTLLPSDFRECDYLIINGILNHSEKMKASEIIISDSPSAAQEDIEALNIDDSRIYYTAGCGNIGIRSYPDGNTEIRREKSWLN